MPPIEAEGKPCSGVPHGHLYWTELGGFKGQSHGFSCDLGHFPGLGMTLRTNAVALAARKTGNQFFGSCSSISTTRHRERPMATQNQLITTAELADILSRPELRLFDCTTYLEPAPAGSGIPYVVVSGRQTFE